MILLLIFPSPSPCPFSSLLSPSFSFPVPLLPPFFFFLPFFFSHFDLYSFLSFHPLASFCPSPFFLTCFSPLSYLFLSSLAHTFFLFNFSVVPFPLHLSLSLSLSSFPFSLNPFLFLSFLFSPIFSLSSFTFSLFSPSRSSFFLSLHYFPHSPFLPKFSPKLSKSGRLAHLSHP